VHLGQMQKAGGLCTCPFSCSTLHHKLPAITVIVMFARFKEGLTFSKQLYKFPANMQSYMGMSAKLSSTSARV
jgi:hypothetical protein